MCIGLLKTPTIQAPKQPRVPMPSETEVQKAGREERRRLMNARGLAATVLTEETGSMPGASLVGTKKLMGE